MNQKEMLAKLDKKETSVSKFKVGDLVFSIQSGWQTVIESSTEQDEEWPIRISTGQYYNRVGLDCLGDFLPSLFTKEEALVKFPEFPPPKRKRTVTETLFINIHPSGARSVYGTRELADLYAIGMNRIVCLETTITYEVEE